MATVLESIAFAPAIFERELQDFAAFLKSKADLAENDDIKPFFRQRKHLTAYLGTFAPSIAVASELCFEYEFFGDYRADILLGSRKEKEFCVVEFEGGAIFKKRPRRNNPAWSARFEHAFSQLTDWFYNLHDFKNTSAFSDTFGAGHVGFTGLIIMGRSADLDEAKRNRLKWRTDRVSIDTHKISCLTFDDLHAALQNKFNLYRAASGPENRTQQGGLPPPTDA